MSIGRIIISKGDKFGTYEELNDKISLFGKQNYTVFSRQTRKISPKQKVQNADKLKYSHVDFKCKCYGYPRSVATERKTHSYKVGCEYIIRVCLSEDRMHLIISEVNLQHKNHVASKELYGYIVNNRRLSPGSKADVEAKIKVGAKLPMIKVELANKNKIVSGKDLSNIKYRLNHQGGDNDLDMFVKLLREEYDCNVDIDIDENSIFKALYFSNTKMRAAMSAWPEILLVDGTYKLLNRGLVLYVFMVTNGIGRGEIVGSALLASEHGENVKWVVETFRDHNKDACQRLHCIMTDKDMTERNVLREVFPDCKLLLCAFHTLQSFTRALSTLECTSDEKKKAALLLQALVYSTSDEEYNNLYDKFSKEAPQKVVDYFNKNWHPIRHEWTRNQMAEKNFGHFTNNRLENMNRLIKSVADKFSTLCQFARRYFIVIDSHSQETDIKTAMEFLKAPTKVASLDFSSASAGYCSHLSEYAFNEVSKQLSMFDKLNLTVSNDITKECTINFRSGVILVDPENCECEFNKTWNLPCKHIFAVRAHFKIPLFEPRLCNERFTKDYIRKNSRFSRMSSSGNSPTPTISVIPRKKPLTTADKRKALDPVSRELVDTASMSCGLRFDNKMRTLVDLNEAWRAGHEVKIQVIKSNQISSVCGDENPLEQPVLLMNDEDNNNNNSILNNNNTLMKISMPSPKRLSGKPSGSHATTSGFFKRKRTS